MPHASENGRSTLSRRKLLAGLGAFSVAKAIEMRLPDHARAISVPEDTESRSVPFIVRWSTTQGPKLDSPVSIKINNQHDLEVLWEQVDPQNPLSVPTVDFKNSIAYFVAQGDESTGQFYLEVESVKLRDEAIISDSVRVGSKKRVTIYLTRKADDSEKGTSSPAILVEIPKLYDKTGREVSSGVTVKEGLPLSLRQQKLMQVEQDDHNTPLPMVATDS